MTDRTCSIVGCNGAHWGRGWCKKHYTRWHRHGDPLFRVENLDRRIEIPAYRTMHNRVEKDKGRADAHLCESCGKKAQSWAYDHSDPDELFEEFPRPNGTVWVLPYSTDSERYAPMCASCHKILDLAAAKARSHA